jgi:F-type H+-transporting ATPase subunit delta
MSQTADRYAKALYELAKENNSLEAVESTMSEIRNLIVQGQDFRQFLSNPLLSYEERCAVLKAIFEGKVSELTLKFLLFITYKGRLDILKDIIQSFDNLYLISTNQVRAYVTTATVLDKEERVLINQHLCEKFQHNMLTRWKEDASIIGGFRIFIQGKIYDYSFKSQLNHYYQQTTQPA